MAPEQSIVYCILPADLADPLHDELRGFFRERPQIEVVVERRCGEDRRSRPRAAAVRAAAGNTPAVRADRRAEHAPAAAPKLPRSAALHAERIAFVSRLEPSTLEQEDRATAALVRRIQAGEAELFARLYTRYFDRVYGYLRIALGDSHEAEDAAQDVFAKALAALPRYEHRASPFRGWLFQIARHAAIDRLRRHSRRVTQLPDDLLERLPAEGDHEPWLGERGWLATIEDLPLAQRQVIVLRYGFDLGGPQIARVLGRSPAAVRQLHRRAISGLRSPASGTSHPGSRQLPLRIDAGAGKGSRAEPELQALVG